MRGTKIHRGAAGIAALSIALGTAGSAFAKPADNPAAPNVRHGAVESFEPASPAGGQPAGSSDALWAYVAIGGGVAGLGLLGVGGTLAADQRRHRKAERPHPTIVVYADSYIWARSSSGDGTTTGPSGR